MASKSWLEPDSQFSLHTDAIRGAHTTAGWYERNRIALQFLHGLERVAFPLSSTERQACESAAVLLQAGLIQAEVHEDLRRVFILGLTEVGREFFSRRHGKAGEAVTPSFRRPPHGPQSTAFAPMRPRVFMSSTA